MRNIDITRFLCATVVLAFLYEMWVNGGNPDICLPAALIGGFPLVLAEAQHQYNKTKRGDK